MNSAMETSLETRTNEELLGMYRETRSQRVRQELTMRYIYIVRSIACQMHEVYRDFMQTEDIVNEGAIEIMKAIDRYDMEKDNKFETFVSRRIRGMVIDMIRRNSWLPRNYHRESREVEAANQELLTRLGRNPTEQELSEHLRMDVRKLQKLQRMSTMINVLSLDMAYEDTEQAFLQIPSEDSMVQPELHFLQQENTRILREAVEALPEKEKLVISLYYVEELNMNQIARVMEISQPRVSQLHTSAVRKLRRYMEQQGEKEPKARREGQQQVRHGQKTELGEQQRKQA